MTSAAPEPREKDRAKARKREWLFSGLLDGHDGHAFVRSKPVRSPVQEKVLVAGDDYARFLAPTIAKLLGSNVHVALRPPGVHVPTWLCGAIERVQPTLLLFALEPVPTPCLAPASTVIWLPPPESEAKLSARIVPSSSIEGWEPTVRGYAAWATAAWQRR